MGKGALYVNKMNELTQEFHYADPVTKIRINDIFNTIFFMVQLWNRKTEKILEHLTKNYVGYTQKFSPPLPWAVMRYTAYPMLIVQKVYKMCQQHQHSNKPTMRQMLYAWLPFDKSGKPTKIDVTPKESDYRRNKQIDQLTKLTSMEIPTGDDWTINLPKELLDLMIIWTSKITRQKLQNMLT